MVAPGHSLMIDFFKFHTTTFLISPKLGLWGFLVPRSRIWHLQSCGVGGPCDIASSYFAGSSCRAIFGGYHLHICSILSSKNLKQCDDNEPESILGCFNFQNFEFEKFLCHIATIPVPTQDFKFFGLKPTYDDFPCYVEEISQVIFLDIFMFSSSMGTSKGIGRLMTAPSCTKVVLLKVIISRQQNMYFS